MGPKAGVRGLSGRSEWWNHRNTVGLSLQLGGNLVFDEEDGRR